MSDQEADVLSTDPEEAAEDQAEGQEQTPDRIDLSVDISEAGPCRKHLRVTVPRSEVDRFFNKEFSDLVKSASVPGFRPGKTPRRLIERRFRKDVASQVKAGLMMQSLEQIGDEQKIDALDEPNIDIEAVELPEDGDFVYEFDVEVRPEFDLPEYKGLKIKRPVREIGESEIDDGLKNFLRRFGAMKPKDTGAVKDDYLEVDIRFLHDGKVINEVENLNVRMDKELVFRDGRVADFAEKMEGVKAGDSREVKAVLSDSIRKEELRGKEVEAVFVVKGVSEQQLPTLDQDFLDSVGCGDEQELRDLVQSSLGRRLEHEQEEAAREQVIEKLLEGADWELPPDLLRRQSERTLQRTIFDLQEAGYPDDEIRAKINVLRQNSMASTARSLKQQFVLERIAESEEIKIEESDLEAEVFSLAQRTGESPRRVRARIEKEQLWDTLGLHILERKAIAAVVSHAEQEDVTVELSEPTGAAGLDESVMPEEAEEGETSAAATEEDSTKAEAEAGDESEAKDS
ncbi:Trigger factor [Planctomycetes bacterium Pan216]|uniref:Trigger factor n=1 Tax=Kolteria novifilia TaxID=2527975 RepID=A0A518AZQ0_9BACT|nr:Trigger factor [Planctomycetes bacterium Pan216]